jgi:hypothetical protein
MRQLTTILRFLLTLALVLPGASAVRAQSSNKLWFATYNGQPTPSLDVSVRSVMTGGTAAALATGAASNFVSQADFHNFNSPYDLAVDPVMGKVYVLDNNLPGRTPTNQYIYSFDLNGTPAQIAASRKIIYTAPVPAADASAGLYPLVSGLALDPAHHHLYFNQFDVITGTNSYVGRLDLTTSANSNVHASDGGNPALQIFYAGQIPGQGSIALDDTNIYLGAINGITGNAGVYAAPRDGGGSFSEIVAISTNDTTFTNGFVSGVASDPQAHLIYYLTFNAGYVNFNFNLAQNALWTYDTVGHTRRKISSGYPGYPNNLALDLSNGRYYFTLGRDGTGNLNATNYQAIYTGILGATNAPTPLYTPVLSGLDAAGQFNSGAVALQGIYVQAPPKLNLAVSAAGYLPLSAPVTLAPSLVVSDPSSSLLTGATVAITGGVFAGAGDVLAVVTNGTAISANYNGATETLTLSGGDSVANYQQVLRSLTFSSTNADPSGGGANGVRTLAWTVTDGLLVSAPAVSTLTIVAPGAPPFGQVAVAISTNGPTILFTGSANQSYVVQSAAKVNGPWSDLSPALTANGFGLVQYQDPTTPVPATRFYRVRSVVSP